MVKVIISKLLPVPLTTADYKIKSIMFMEL